MNDTEILNHTRVILEKICASSMSQEGFLALIRKRIDFIDRERAMQGKEHSWLKEARDTLAVREIVNEELDKRWEKWMTDAKVFMRR
jgi:hypothetical protein